MRPKRAVPREDELFRARLDNIVDPKHPLVRLATLIDWQRFDVAFGACYAEKGRPGLPTRLMAGIHLLKHLHGLSDEEVCARWVENPYFQFFCGEAFFQHQLVFDRSSMTRWRRRIGADQLETLLAETIAVAQRSKAMTAKACKRVTIDTTVQTKAVAHPSDSHLLLRAILWLNRLARQHGIRLRQSYLRVACQTRRTIARLIHGRGDATLAGARARCRRLSTCLQAALTDQMRRVSPTSHGNRKTA